MATDAQIEANRQNAKRSCGPRTTLGKASSRRNSLKLGLTGKGIVLPEADAQAVAERTESWGASYRLANEEERWLMKQIAIETVRLDRCHHEERSRRIERAHRAEVCWDDDRMHEARELFAKLSKEPSVVSMELRLSSQGCALLIASWEALAAVLKAGTPWNDDRRALAEDLLGIAHVLREGSSWIDAPPGEDAVEWQQSIAREEVELLKSKADALAELDEWQRDRAIRGLAPPDREQMRLLRYEAACHRRYQAAWRRLQPLRLSNAVKPARRAASTPDRLSSAATAAAAEGGGFRLIPEPEPLDPFAELDEEDDPELEELLARLGTLRSLDNAAQSTALESAVAPQSQQLPATAPATPSASPVSPPAIPPTGNRRSRRAKLRRERMARK